MKNGSVVKEYTKITLRTNRGNYYGEGDVLGHLNIGHTVGDGSGQPVSGKFKIIDPDSDVKSVEVVDGRITKIGYGRTWIWILLGALFIASIVAMIINSLSGPNH